MARKRRPNQKRKKSCNGKAPRSGLTELLKVIRTDHGGKDPVELLRRKMRERGLGIHATDGVIKFILERCWLQVAGSRKRVRTRAENLDLFD